MTVASTPADPRVMADDRLSRVLDFVGQLVLPSGETLGSSFQGAPWLVELLEALLARTEEGLPRCKLVALNGPRGLGKTTVSAAWLLTDGFLSPGMDGRCIAADAEQAELAVSALRSFLEQTPRLAELVQIMASSVRFRNKSRVQVLASDVASSFGLGAGVRTLRLAADEWPAWPTHAQALFESLLGSAVKQPDAQLLMTGTPGLEGTWQHELWGQLLADPEVKVITVREIPPWVRKEDVALAERLLPAASFRRFFKAEWVAAAGSFLSSEEWDRLLERDSPPLGPNGKIVLALDAALSRDTFAAVACSRDPRAARDGVIVRDVKVWEAPDRGVIDFGEVKEWIISYVRKQPVCQITFDPWQLAWLARELQDEAHVWTCAFDQGTQREASDTALLNLVKNGKLHHDGHPVLRQHMLNADFRITLEGSKGRLRKRSERAPIDAAVAVSMATHQAMYLLIDP